MQEALDSRVNARSWVVTPEDLPKARKEVKREAYNILESIRGQLKSIRTCLKLKMDLIMTWYTVRELTL